METRVKKPPPSWTRVDWPITIKIDVCLDCDWPNDSCSKIFHRVSETSPWEIVPTPVSLHPHPQGEKKATSFQACEWLWISGQWLTWSISWYFANELIHQDTWATKTDMWSNSGLNYDAIQPLITKNCDLMSFDSTYWNSSCQSKQFPNQSWNCLS